MNRTAERAFDVAIDEIIGTRSEQQDSALIVPWGEDAVLCILADGMGGHVGGATASRLAVAAFAEKFQDANARNATERLDDALVASNEAIYRGVEEDGALAGMGCTLIGALIAPTRLTWISVGDSLLFSLRGRRLERLNADHSGRSELDALLRAGEITQAEANSDPRRNMLLSALTGDDIALIDRGERALTKGERVLLASDGIETLEPSEIAEILENKPNSAKALAKLLAAVEARGLKHQDNTTCLLARALKTPSAKSILKNSDQFDVLTGVAIAGALAMILLAFGLSFFGSDPSG